MTGDHHVQYQKSIERRDTHEGSSLNRAELLTRYVLKGRTSHRVSIKACSAISISLEVALSLPLPSHRRHIVQTRICNLRVKESCVKRGESIR